MQPARSWKYSRNNPHFVSTIIGPPYIHSAMAGKFIREIGTCTTAFPINIKEYCRNSAVTQSRQDETTDVSNRVPSCLRFKIKSSGLMVVMFRFT
jgi:hypothetical protein